MDAETPHTSARREILKYFNVITHPTYTEGFLLGHDKAFLIKKTEEALGLDHRFTVAVGDSHNDVDMMRYAAVSVAMGNAPDEVKNVIKCKNPRCITSTEQELDHVFKLVDREKRVYRCIYCESSNS
jgi:hydroxymethylpyrimidine pyrophosphatase-like HAD family hydrolase